MPAQQSAASQQQNGASVPALQNHPSHHRRTNIAVRARWEDHTLTEKTGYATQKPLGILERIVRVHSNPGDLVLDFFAGSGTTGEAASMNGREFCLVDESAEAIAVMEKRLGMPAERIANGD
jgi:DNA modification methylase